MEHIDLKPNSLFLEKGQVDWTQCYNQGQAANVIYQYFQPMTTL